TGRPRVGNVGQQFQPLVTERGDAGGRFVERMLQVGIGTESQTHGAGCFLIRGRKSRTKAPGRLPLAKRVDLEELRATPRRRRTERVDQRPLRARSWSDHYSS